MDLRLRCALDSSLSWYEALCTAHDVGSQLSDGLWMSLEPALPLHSDAVVVEPGVRADQVIDGLRDRSRCSVKDSFANLDLIGGGFRVLFSATWLYRPIAVARTGSAENHWETVRTADELADWNSHYDTTGVLIPSLLRRASFRFLVQRDGGRAIAGAVAHVGTGVVHVSNVHAVPGRQVNWAELAGAVSQIFPDRALVGYEREDQLRDAIGAGFEPVGPLRVWHR